MKRIYYLYVIILGSIMIGCNPLEDINNEINANKPGVIEAVELTLTDDDYTEDIDDGGLGLDRTRFDSEDDAKTMLPDFLAELYPFLGDGSSVTVNYNLFIGNAEGVSDYSGADIYQLTNADYASTGSDAFGFYPNVYANEEIPAVLDAAITGATEGDIVLAKYEQYFENPEVGLANVYQASFPANFGDFENIDVLGAEGWTSQSGYAQGSGFNGGALANEDWLISPEIDLTGMTNLKFQINQEIDFLGDPSLFDVLISTDYTTGGDPMAATWTAVSFDKSLFGDMSLSEDIDFPYGGATIHVALKYSSTDSDSPRWRVESFAIKTIGVTGSTDKKGTHFVYDGGEWEVVDGVYFLSASDFDSMGEESGQPGRFNNFGSSTPAEDYLPTFLRLTEPWAYGQEEDEVIMVYDYFSSFSGAQIRGNRYTFTDGNWVGHEQVIRTSLQFGLEDGVWVPDNTIRYTLVASDYDLVATALLTEPGFEDAAGNLNSFGNFNRSGGSTNWSDEMVVTGLAIVLESLDPSAAEGQKYIITIATWAPGDSTEDFSLIKTGGEWVAN
ncbi:choice-of-anchor J domain-containing protein [uncultured Algibacter sp.]|uniref:choice-of-anchor J domain-containing protein n=1 Tax=uncultured Algibacter sp. TaxID=298659 RepID=UPI0026245182|nr:choice-of-anchor J domain-containing protein [uncultured Algibacter sp.]